MTDKPRPRFDSRRWTGRYRPGEAPPEFAGAPRRRRRTAKWLLAGIMLAAIALAAAQPLDTGRAPFALPAIVMMLANLGRGSSPFGDGFLTPPLSDDPEINVLLARATALGYRVLTLLVAAALGWYWYAVDRGWPVAWRAADVGLWFAAFVVVATCLPALLAELIVPFPPKA